MAGRLRTVQQTLWAVDALLFVMIFTVLLLVLPIPKTTAPVSGR
jgi:hypothetical protein